MERAELKSLIAATGCAVEHGDFVFLIDPNASAAEQAEAKEQIAGGPTANPNAGLGWIGIRTGGSGGAIKFARHDEQTLGAAARGFRAHFGLARVNAIDVLPAHHVSGLMARIRCAVTGGRHVAWSWKALEAGDRPGLDSGEWVLSLVPTQLARLLESPEAVAWLQRLAIVFVGGGPVWPELAESAARARLRLSLSYGMTETAAMIAALRPEDFLAGARGSGGVMPHARISIDRQSGTIAIEGDSLFRGYWPEWRDARRFETEDLGRFDERGHLHVLGRRDAMIITGGKKVHPADVEAALHGSGEFVDVVVLGVPDREWGELVVACYPRPTGDRPAPDLARAVSALAPHQRPKRFIAIDDWPRTLQGKINRKALGETVRRLL